MISGLISRFMAGAVAAVGLSAAGVGLSTPMGSGVSGPLGSCRPAIGVASAAPTDSPSPSCSSEKQQCMSANVQIGIYGERYVPPDAVAMCMDAYRDCVNANS